MDLTESTLCVFCVPRSLYRGRGTVRLATHGVPRLGKDEKGAQIHEYSTAILRTTGSILLLALLLCVVLHVLSKCRSE